MNKEILRLAIPNILTNLTVPLVSLVDFALMGHMASPLYIVAIGFGTLLFNFIYWAFGFLRMSTTGLVAQAYGKNDFIATKTLLYRGLLLAFIAAFGLVLLQYPIKELSLYLLHPENSVIISLKEYFNIRIWAAFATISLFVMTAWFLGMQDSKSALIIALLVNGLNVIFSLVLVHFYHLGIKGVALGTVLAQYIGLFAAIAIIRFKFKVKLRKGISLTWLKDKVAWRSFLSVNSDIFIRTLLLIFTMSFFKTKAGNVDPVLGAANLLLMEFLTIASYGIDGFAFTAESICGKYFGIGNRKKFKRSITLSFQWGMALAILLSLLFAVGGELLLGVLTDKKAVISQALIYLPWLVIAPLISSFAFIWDGVYIGTTSSAAMRNTMLLATFFVFIPAFFIGRFYLQNHGIWLAFTLFMMARGLFLWLLSKRKIYDKISAQ